jgi:hypothetical protein
MYGQREREQLGFSVCRHLRATVRAYSPQHHAPVCAGGEIAAIGAGDGAAVVAVPPLAAAAAAATAVSARATPARVMRLRVGVSRGVSAPEGLVGVCSPRGMVSVQQVLAKLFKSWAEGVACCPTPPGPPWGGWTLSERRRPTLTCFPHSRAAPACPNSPYRSNIVPKEVQRTPRRRQLPRKKAVLLRVFLECF